ncbi:MAG TPA: hypothetical protein VGR19_00255 [Allosphingosinicella sp.]|nr:hypothetical protein [Allosphingosinicella sp.]
MSKQFIWRVGAAAAILVIATPAVAQRYSFNKAGVSRESYMADVAECGELAGGAKAPDVHVPHSPNLVAVGVTAFFSGMMRNREKRRLMSSIERTCMADKGYARMEADDALLGEIDRIKTEEERLDRLFGLASAAKPSGKRMKE